MVSIEESIPRRRALSPICRRSTAATQQLALSSASFFAACYPSMKISTIRVEQGTFTPELLSMLGTRIRHGGVILIKYCRLIADSSSIGVRDNRLARESSHLSLGRCQRDKSIDRFDRAIDSLA
jgi:hypothetical protein